MIEVMQSDGLVEQAAQTGQVMGEMLAELVERHPSVGEVRSIGLFGVIELVRNRKTREPMAPFNGSSPEMTALRKALLEHGLFVYTHWHTVLIIPPLIITEAQLQEGFAILDQALEITDRAAERVRQVIFDDRIRCMTTYIRKYKAKCEASQMDIRRHHGIQLSSPAQNEEHEHHPYKVLILGSGPAGWQRRCMRRGPN